MKTASNPDAYLALPTKQKTIKKNKKKQKTNKTKKTTQ
jgi:hypothetical protein